MLHPSLLYKSSSPECQFSLSSSSQAKIQLRRLALLPLHFTLSVFSSLAAAGCGRRLGSEACQGTRAQSGAKKKKREKKHQQNNKKPPNPGVCSHLSPKPKQNLAAKPAAGVAEQEAPKPALNLRGRNPAYNFSQRKREGERKKKRI